MPRPLAAFDSEGWVGILANTTKTGGAQTIFMRNSFNAQVATVARKAVCAAFALSLGLAAAAPAHAVDFSFNFTDPNYGSGNNKQTSSVADSQVGGSNPPSFATATFTRTVSATKSLDLQISAWSIDTAPTTDRTYNAIMKFWSGGIGILNDDEVAQADGETNGSPDHAIDNDNNNVDFLVLQFSKPVNLKSITLGWISGDSDVTIGWGDAPGATWNVLPVLNNVAIDPNSPGGLDSMIFGQKTFAGTASSSTTDPRLTPNGAKSDFWIISAANPNVDEDPSTKKTKFLSDYMKLSAIVVSEYPPLPEPGTWMTMILGFGALGGMMRRRKFAITYNKLAA
jgi:hypothetical protein